MAGPLSVDIVAPDRVLWSGSAESIVVPAAEGELGLLPNHEPILAVLQAGNVRVRDGGDEPRVYPITGGFISFDHNAVTIVADLEPEPED